jgi:hypothetical protein
VIAAFFLQVYDNSEKNNKLMTIRPYHITGGAITFKPLWLFHATLTITSTAVFTRKLKMGSLAARMSTEGTMRTFYLR